MTPAQLAAVREQLGLEPTFPARAAALFGGHHSADGNRPGGAFPHPSLTG